MSESIYVLPVRQPEAQEIAEGVTRQLTRVYPCQPEFIGKTIALQATTHRFNDVPRMGVREWSIVGFGTLSGVGYYPGFQRDPEHAIGKSYKRQSGQPGPWIWTFTRVHAVNPVALERLPEAAGVYDPGLNRHVWAWEDDGSGDAWGCCPRELDAKMSLRVREARRKGNGK